VLTFAVPGAMPEALAANANLYVTPEKSKYDNTKTGTQVVEVVEIDIDINETNESNGEPDVTINGKKLRMAQATDGNWYGYFADKTMATTADQLIEDNSVDAGYGIDFGQFCGPTSTSLASNETTQIFSDTVGVAIPIRANDTGYGVNGTTTIAACTTSFHGAGAPIGSLIWHNGARASDDVRITANSTYSATNDVTSSSATVSTGVAGSVSNVVREAKAINQNTATGNGIGQIGLIDDGIWPFVQLYDFTAGGSVNIQYNKGGSVQTTSLTFDTIGASEPKRNYY
jgi:hypothetical protein